MRGQKTFNDIIRDSGLSGTGRKGRNNTLLSKRNECLAARYYYYGHFKNKCYEDIMRLLMNEFFISPNTIVFLIQDQEEQLQTLKKKAPVLYFFQHNWPHLKWQ
jgi:hypothetical protein